MVADMTLLQPTRELIILPRALQCSDTKCTLRRICTKWTTMFTALCARERPLLPQNSPSAAYYRFSARTDHRRERLSTAGNSASEKHSSI